MTAIFNFSNTGVNNNNQEACTKHAVLLMYYISTLNWNLGADVISYTCASSAMTSLSRDRPLKTHFTSVCAHIVSHQYI